MTERITIENYGEGRVIVEITRDRDFKDLSTLLLFENGIKTEAGMVSQVSVKTSLVNGHYETFTTCDLMKAKEEPEEREIYFDKANMSRDAELHHISHIDRIKKHYRTGELIKFPDLVS